MRFVAAVDAMIVDLYKCLALFLSEDKYKVAQMQETSCDRQYYLEELRRSMTQ